MASILDFPERDTVVTEALSWPERARAAVVRTVEDYTRAADLLKGIKALRQKIADTFDPHVRRAHEAHKALVREKSDAEAPLSEAERIIKNALVAFDQEQERLRREEEARQRELARVAEEARVLEQAAAMEIEAHEYGDTGLAAEAEALIQRPIQAPPIAPVAKATPKVAGISMRTVYKFRIVNAALVPRQYLTVDEQKIGGVVRALGQAANIPGVEVYPDQVVAAGRSTLQ